MLLMSIERKIVSYLESFGNTRENDLISYGVQNLGRPADDMKKTIDRMAVKGKLHRIVHNKLKPPEVYITLEEPLPPECAVECEVTNKEVARILQEAASVARETGLNRSS
jgi:hypothetical protein